MNDGRFQAPPAQGRAFGLKPGISFCRVDGRTIFLDVPADRYLCLSPAGEQAFTRLLDGLALEDHHLSALANLARTGPLLRGDHASPLAPCPTVPIPRPSHLDDFVRPGLVETVAAALSLIRSPLKLRAVGLRRTLAGIDRSKHRANQAAALRRQAKVAAAFARLRLIATEKDNCLTRSIAVTERLIAIGARPQLVIAVKLQPFYAHAWVQCDGWLINDRHEFVRNYTPILVI